MQTRSKLDKPNGMEAAIDKWIADGEAFYKAHQYKEALRCYQQAVECDARNAKAWHFHAQALVLCLKYPESIVSCDKALELNQQDAATWFLKSFAQGVLGEYQKAVESCTKGLELNPGNKMAWCTKGQCLYALGKLEEAITSFDMALKMNPDNEYFQVVHAKIKKWLDRDVQNDTRISQVLAFLRQGGTQATLQSYKESLKVDPRSVTKAFNKDFALAHLENPERMMKEFEQTRIQDQPQITLGLSQKEFEFSHESWVEIVLTNKGKTPARDISFRLSSEVTIKQLDVSPELLQQIKTGNKTCDLDLIPELQPGNRIKKLVSLTPAKLGQIALTVQIRYTDIWDTPQNKTTIYWISVFKPGEQLPSIPGHRLFWRLSASESANIYFGLRTADSLKVVIKIPKFTSEHSSLITEFMNEVKRSGKLNHPNIVRIYQYGESPFPWISMEYMAGGTLTRRIGRISILESLRIGIQLADAIAFARTICLSLRCINPENVLFAEKDVPKLINWRISNIIHKLHKNNAISANVNAYYPPEKIAPRLGSIDWLSDIYQLGVLLYEMVTGQPPFIGKGQELMAKIEKENPLRPGALNAEINKELEYTILTCMAKNKKHRYQSPETLKSELGKIISFYKANT